MLEELAAEGVDLNKPRDPDGLLPIDACAWSGCTSGVMALLRLGASASKSVQAVAGAAAWGHPELLEALLAAGGPVDQDFSNSTPLRWAVEMSHEDCAEILVRYGAWKAEPEQDAVLGRARRKRLRSLLDAIAQALGLLCAVRDFPGAGRVAGLVLQLSQESDKRLNAWAPALECFSPLAKVQSLFNACTLTGWTALAGGAGHDLSDAPCCRAAAAASEPRRALEREVGGLARRAMAREEGLLSTTVETIWQACVLLIGLFLAFVAWGTRSLWRPVIDALLAGVDSPRNIPLVGRCCACLCPCAVAQYHPPFRLRVVVHGGWRLRRPPDLGASSDPMQCYVVLRCGVNPPKTTCVQPVPVGIYLSDRNPVMWDDVLDVEVRVSDDVLVLEVVDCTLEPPEHVVGRVDLSIAEIYSDLSGELGSEGVMSAELVTRKLMHLSKDRAPQRRSNDGRSSGG
ncbi:unnamed protein product [Prorocentrum cordatum]|uniref:C2 domain-containing protein n=1 Tax=Prorocentrum cordatum TaxID=2364126 RepID=A0ABN9TE11_9DINO|nr:unnamed protein product [Polarella glacialis]